MNIFHTAPTTIRMLRKLGPDEPQKYDYHFKHMTTVGEPIEPDVWRWYHDVVGKGEAVIVDTWWQTENGGFLGSTMPALQPMKPGSCGPGVLGIYPVIYDEDGNEVEAGSGRAGNICIRNPWPGIFQTIWGQPERFVQLYYEKYCRDTGEHRLARLAVLRRRRRGAGGRRLLPDPRPGRRRDQRGRPPAGHQGARVGEPHRRGGRRGGRRAGDRRAAGAGSSRCTSRSSPASPPARRSRRRWPRRSRPQIGKIARPKHVWIVPDMPKTRSGKIMRRVIAGISNFADVGDDTTTLANPEIVDDIRRRVQSEKVTRGDVPRKLSPQEIEEIKAFGHAE